MSSHVSPAARASAALMAGRIAFIPVDATLAPGPYMPPLRSDNRVAVNGSVRPPGGPDRNFAITASAFIQHQPHRIDRYKALTLFGGHLVPVRRPRAVLRSPDAGPVPVPERHLRALVSPVRGEGIEELRLALVNGHNVVVARGVKEAEIRLRGRVARE